VSGKQLWIWRCRGFVLLVGVVAAIVNGTFAVNLPLLSTSYVAVASLVLYATIAAAVILLRSPGRWDVCATLPILACIAFSAELASRLNPLVAAVVCLLMLLAGIVALGLRTIWIDTISEQPSSDAPKGSATRELDFLADAGCFGA
jgi:hypothetical protein